jgi:hypothetical protein
MMTISFDKKVNYCDRENWIKFWVIENSPVLCSKITELPDCDHSFLNIYDAFVKQMNNSSMVKYGAVYSIVDFTELQQYSFMLLISFFARIAPELMKSRLVLMAIIKPKCISQEDLSESINVLDQLPIGIFSTMKEAKNYIQDFL